MSHGEGESSGSVSHAEFSQLLSAMKGIQDQMTAMKRELSEERDAADERLVKKMRLDKGIQFKKKGNEKQHQFNEKVKDRIEAASRFISATPPAVEKAKEALQEGEQLITARQKLIRIADRSEYGWNTVAEYEEDELADGSDDEKRLYKAELRAGRKVKSTKTKLKRKDQSNTRREWSARPKWQPPLSSQSNNFTAMPQLSSPSGVIRPPMVRPQLTLGPCFECGMLGHIRKNCPQVTKAS